MEATAKAQRIATVTMALANEGNIPTAAMTLDSPIPPALRSSPISVESASANGESPESICKYLEYARGR